MRSLGATTDWAQVPGWGASVSPTAPAPPPSTPTVAPGQQLPPWWLWWKGGCITEEARRVRKGRNSSKDVFSAWNHTPCPSRHGRWFWLQTADPWCFSGSSLRFVLALWINRVRRSHFNSHAFRSNYTFKWLNKSGRKHIYCSTKAVNTEILFYISITSRL